MAPSRLPVRLILEVSRAETKAFRTRHPNSRGAHACCPHRRRPVYDALTKRVSIIRTPLEREVDAADRRPPAGLSWWPLALIVFVLQILVVQVLGRIDDTQGSLWVLIPVTHFALLPFLLRNFKFLGMRIVFVGFALNLAVMIANGGLMPVEEYAIAADGRRDVEDLQVGQAIPATKNVFVAADGGRLGVLSDAIVLPLPRPLTRVVSAGDLLIVTGVMLALGGVISRSRDRLKLQPRTVDLAARSRETVGEGAKHWPGDKAPPGRYCCSNCGWSIQLDWFEPLPPCGNCEMSANTSYREC